MNGKLPCAFLHLALLFADGPYILLFLLFVSRDNIKDVSFLVIDTNVAAFLLITTNLSSIQV